ncbi:unnamed protein product [Leptidea sinapis]|uniref:N-terminal methionine N(alpha)-acetyltransferase NatC n=1 Tax=Leptidea sinapis TaxID=189913 RepID=A0A5E4PWI0_9NEOP|nr:unnamed protein product [Leptidea sinapis]
MSLISLNFYKDRYSNKMNEVADDKVHNIQKCASAKNKTSKDPSRSTEDKCLANDENLSETMTEVLHISHNNLTNGTSEHNKSNIINSQPDLDLLIEEAAPSESFHVNSVHCSDLKDTKEDNDSRSKEHQEKTGNCHRVIEDKHGDFEIISYESELQMPEIMRLIQKDLSEPYSIYTYRYFIHNWPKLCFLATYEQKCIGAIVCKLDMHRNVKRGYIAMLAVDKKHRTKGIGSRLVQKAIQVMIDDNADEVVLETEITNKPALKLYENLGFVRDKRLFRYYLNGVDALRLKLWLR